MRKIHVLVPLVLVTLFVARCDDTKADDPQWIGEVYFAPTVVGMLEGQTETVKLKIRETPEIPIDLTLEVTSGDESAVSFPLTVTFEPGEEWTLLDVVRMQNDLSGIIGRRVDLVLRENLVNPFRRHHILRTRQVIDVA